MPDARRSQRGDRLPGSHNGQNAAAAAALALDLGLADADIARGLLSFPGLAHRQERVRALNGVAYVNDSKATNAAAAARALACYTPIYWIAGGRAKDGGITALSAFFPRIRHAYLIGEAARDFARDLEGHAPYSLCGALPQAVDQAHHLAQAEHLDGATVLLAPAAASFDQFDSFEARGEVFRQQPVGDGADTFCRSTVRGRLQGHDRADPVWPDVDFTQRFMLCM